MHEIEPPWTMIVAGHWQEEDGSSLFFGDHSINSTHSILSYALLMQDPKKSSQPRPWYRKAMEMATLWKALAKPSEIPSPNATIWRTRSISKTSTTTDISSSNNSTKNNKKLKKCTSLKLASSFTRACLCVPISSYAQVFQAENIPPRRSFSYPPSRSSSSRPPSLPSVQEPVPRTLSGRISTEGRKIFRGKSLTDDVLMRRFVAEEEEAMMQVRRRNEMEIIRKRCSSRRRRLGPSPLCRMILAEDEEYNQTHEI
ncbi:hypothetical protein Leryth_003826 [Lithospermum erythrorhizon]|nr:hypothetical protein Leryth_003826 [Lithospermum erythrorhizon]